jgi:type IV pilus assembly protein PilE|tara:strand:- start:445 stop:870 length:426 start_codon:yes stop_codon:yes gene_type:complete
MNTRSRSGFTLIELLVVVAIIGILAAVGILSYSGYVEGAKKKSAENVMQKIGLANTENYSDYGVYWASSTSTCSPNQATSEDIEENLLGGVASKGTFITDEINFYMCIWGKGSDFEIIAKNRNSSCTLKLNQNLGITRENC